MKLMIASDIHGSAYYCKLLINAFEKSDCEKLVLLGDLLYHGPRNDLPKDYDPKTVAALLNSISDRIICVRGNCESEVDQMMLTFPCLAEYAVILDGNITMTLSHGHNTEKLEKCLPKGSFLLCGHTHIPKVEVFENFTKINPGSVSIPKENSTHGALVYENGSFERFDL